MEECKDPQVLKLHKGQLGQLLCASHQLVHKLQGRWHVTTDMEAMRLHECWRPILVPQNIPVMHVGQTPHLGAGIWYFFKIEESLVALQEHLKHSLREFLK